MVGDFAARQAERFGCTPGQWSRLSASATLVTGAGTGLGQYLALALCSAGGRVVLLGRRRHKLEETVAQAKALGLPVENLLIAPCDLECPDHLEGVIAELDIAISALVHCAALPPALPDRAYLLSTSNRQWNAIMATNCTAAWLLAKALVPGMISRGFGRIVFLSSGAGWAGTPGVGPYNVSKAALNSLAYSLAFEITSGWPDIDFQVNALDPGEFASEMNQGAMTTPEIPCRVALRLLSTERGGPTGRFFRQNGSARIFGDMSSAGPNI